MKPYLTECSEVLSELQTGAEGLSSARRGRPSGIYGLTFIKSVVPPRKSPERKEPGEGTRHER